mmetsp:Transcript_23098/g.37107  ORF Transcript_23098/g.37107 Transcript_23098/m.37107 type:complete len:97 (-) Transcript_23098:1412-1702(-)
MYLLEWLVSDATKCVIAAGCVVHAILYKNPKKKLQLPRNVNLVLSIILTAFYIGAREPFYFGWQAYVILADTIAVRKDENFLLICCIQYMNEIFGK